MSDTTTPEQGSELELIRDEINQLVSQISSTQWRLGIIYNYATSARLAEAVGHKNAWDYFSKYVKGISRTSLSMYSNMAFYIAQDFVARYGTERIRAWLTYQRALRTTIPRQD